jgi:hypothetical protein
VRAPPVLAAALNVTDPFPLPLLPEVTVTHPAPLLAVHEQPLPVATAMVVVPPGAGIAAFDGLTW